MSRARTIGAPRSEPSLARGVKEPAAMHPNFILLTERFLAVTLVAIGLSHIVAARAWIALFADLFTKPWAGLLLGALTLPFGLSIVLLHNLWVPRLALATTIVGWGWTIKGTLYLLAPRTPARVSRRVLSERTIVIGGGVSVLLGAAIALGAFLPPR